MPPDPPAPEGAERPRRRWRQRLLIGLGVALVLGCLAAAVGIAYGSWQLRKVDRVDVALPPVADGGPVTYLVVGSDSRAAITKNDPNAGAMLDGTAAGRRSDTILVVRIDPHSEKAAVLSLPRDLWVAIPGKADSNGDPIHQRINSFYGDGPQALVDALRADLGIDVNHYVEVDFRGFQKMVDAVGGVQLWFDRPYRDLNSGLRVDEPGCRTLDGSQALAFARARHLDYQDERGRWHTDPTGDLGRISRQQLFLRRALHQIIGPQLANPLNLKHLVDAGVSNVTIDRNLSVTDLLSLARRFRNFNADNLATLSVPVTNFRTDGGAAVVRLDPEAEPILDFFRTTPKGPLTPDQVSVRVLNGSGTVGQASDAGGALQAVGFRITTVGDASDVGLGQLDHTEVRYRPGDRTHADLVARYLTSGATLVEDENVQEGEVELVTGTDFTTVESSARDTAAATTTTAADAGRAADGGTTTGTEATAPSTPSTTTTTVIGRVPGEPPAGRSCG